MEFKNNVYMIDKLCLAKLGKTCITPDFDNEDETIFILSREYVDNGYNCIRRYEENYADAILGVPISYRYGAQPFNSLPDEIKEIFPFPIEYCAEEELVKGYISDIRLYQIFRNINITKRLNRD